MSIPTIEEIKEAFPGRIPKNYVDIEYKTAPKVELPKDLNLPFFAYGVFKPGELAFLQIKDFTEHCVQGCKIPYILHMRDGLPIAAPQKSNYDQEILGTIIRFRQTQGEEAYNRIASMEPENQYRWAVTESNNEKVNFLMGRSPDKGVYPHPFEDWNGKKDPLFTDALKVVKDTLHANCNFDSSLESLFRLEMAYLLLWTVIERYASLRYHLGGKATDKVSKIANEIAFIDALKNNVKEERKITRAHKPEQICTLSPDKPEKSIDYYYQLRSNLVHRGKGAYEDYGRLKSSLKELLHIFESTLKAAFEESIYSQQSTRGGI